MGPIGCIETSVRNYNYTLCNRAEERSSHLLRGGSLNLLKSSVSLTKFNPREIVQIERARTTGICLGILSLSRMR